MLDFGVIAHVIEKDIALVTAQKICVGVQPRKWMRHIRLPQVIVELFQLDISLVAELGDNVKYRDRRAKELFNVETH